MVMVAAVRATPHGSAVLLFGRRIASPGAAIGEGTAFFSGQIALMRASVRDFAL